jgi:subtilisin family serine protease
MSSSWRRIFCSLFLGAAAVALVAALASSDAIGQRIELKTSQRAPAQKIASWVVEHTTNGQQAEFFVVLADQADLSPAANLQTKTEKGRFVYQTLLEKAQSTQEPILQFLRDRHIEYQSFYIVNAILVKGDRQLAETFAARPDVSHVTGNPIIHNDLPQRGPVERSPLIPRAPGAPATIEPGVQYIHAPDVWALGFKGETIVVASADTGVRWTHNALKPHYRGWDGANANHNFNWHDSIHDSVGNPCGNDSQQPCDDFFHGSHTTGTAIGDDGGTNQIGVAPGAKWIACRNMDQGNGTPARYIECMEFFLAPYPLNCTPNEGDPTKAPDITINSWGCPTTEGCVTGDELRTAVEAQEAAGIQMVVAAGNSGSACSTVSDPPSFYAASYTVGALNTGTDTIADFSSRGPVTRDGSNRTKPDITAPGTNTRSCDNSADDAYTFASGTSMATPHISGSMALLWSAIPSLQNQIQPSRDALDNSAHFISDTTCGPAGPPNNVYGWGRVDIAAAVGTPAPTPTVSPTPVSSATPCGVTSPTPTATATPASPTPTATATPTPTSPTPTATPTATASVTPTPRAQPRSRPTPHPRPTPP